MESVHIYVFPLSSPVSKMLYSFFSSSTHRWELLIENRKGFKGLSDIHWMFIPIQLKSVVKENMETIVSTLEGIQVPSKHNLVLDQKQVCYFEPYVLDCFDKY